MPGNVTSDSDHERDSFLEHNQRMRKFRESHLSSLQPQAGLLASTFPYRVSSNMVEAERSRQISTADWAALVPWHGASRSRLWLN